MYVVFKIFNCCFFHKKKVLNALNKNFLCSEVISSLFLKELQLILQRKRMQVDKQAKEMVLLKVKVKVRVMTRRSAYLSILYSFVSSKNKNCNAIAVFYDS